jgi:hypothetical protein
MNIPFPEGPGFVVSMISDVELTCGCMDSHHVPLYDMSGKCYEVFDSSETASEAAEQKLKSNSYYDRYRIISLSRD